MKKYGENLLETLKQDCMLNPNQKKFILLIGAYCQPVKKWLNKEQEQ
jgi:hypothetical protein